MRQVFIVTSVFLFLMGLKFIGEGLQVFQEQASIPYDTAPFGDKLQLVGLNPSWEALAAQAAVLLTAFGAIAWSRWTITRSVPPN